MKTFVLSAGHASPHAGWAAIDELATLLARYLGAELLAPQRTPPNLVSRLLGRVGPSWEPLHCSGGDLLIVVAHAPQDLSMIDAIANCRKKFARIVGWVTDSYFQAGFGRVTAQYDALTVTAHEDLAGPRDRFGVDTRVVYQGADGLAWAPPLHALRSIDLIGFGRMPPSYHAQFANEFHRGHSPYLYLHSPLGNVTGPSVHLERGMLFKLLHRTRISLAFHLFVEPQGQRPRSMMVTSRWLESLLSGCIVAGKRPVSRMADDMLSWQGATVELSDDPQQALEQLRGLLVDPAGLEVQRRVNVRHMLQLHDWRHRIVELCEVFNLPAPALLHEDLGRLREIADRFN
jgi:hypothetical protein